MPTEGNGLDDKAGLGVDRHGNPVIDPTKNVLQLVEAAVRRSDDLAAAETRRVNEIMELRAEYTEKLSLAEAKRIDAIRAVDVSAVTVASERAAAQTQVLARQVETSAEALRSSLATNAATLAAQLTTITSQLSDRISSLEKSQYEIRGTGAGRKDFYGWIIGGVGVVFATLAIVLRLLGK
jgi:multidrug efflux pump subunit AcrA (membrane-fusion protein)